MFISAWLHRDTVLFGGESYWCLHLVKGYKHVKRVDLLMDSIDFREAAAPSGECNLNYQVQCCAGWRRATGEQAGVDGRRQGPERSQEVPSLL